MGDRKTLGQILNPLGFPQCLLCLEMQLLPRTKQLRQKQEVMERSLKGFSFFRPHFSPFTLFLCVSKVLPTIRTES